MDAARTLQNEHHCGGNLYTLHSYGAYRHPEDDTVVVIWGYASGRDVQASTPLMY